MISENIDSGLISVNDIVRSTINKEIQRLNIKVENDIRDVQDSQRIVSDGIHQLHNEVIYLQGRVTHNEEYIKKLTSYIKTPWWKRIFKKFDL